MQKFLFKNNKGFTLVEIMVAIGVLGIFGSALMAMVLQSQAVAQSAKLKNQATRYSEQLIERTRAYRDSNTWTAFYNATTIWSGTFGGEDCWYDIPPVTEFQQPTGSNCSANQSSAPAIPGTNSQFKQFIGISSVNANLVKVTSYVYYNDRGKSTTVSSSSYLTNEN